MTKEVVHQNKDQASGEDVLSWSDLSWHVYIKAAVILTLFYALFHVEIENIVSRWVNDSSWSHGFLIPAFSLYFINQKKEQILTLKPKPNWVGLALLVACLLFYPFNIGYFHFGYFRPLTVIAALGSVVLFLGGLKLTKYLWLPIGYLIFAVPLPDSYHFALTHPMRKLAAQTAAGILSLIKGVEATATGVVIDVLHNGKPLESALNVADACSGMRLLMAFLALGVAMAYLHDRPVWQRLVLLASTIPIAILCNIVRVTTTGFIYVFGDPKYAQGIYHDGLGLLMLPLAFGLYGLLAAFMENLFVEDIPEEQRQDLIIKKE